MSTIASKNQYELLGNDPELDPDRPADPPGKAIDKPVARSGKRNDAATGGAIDAPRGGARGGRDGGMSRGEQGSGPRSDRRDDGQRQDRRTREGGEGRGGRGRGGRARGDEARGGRGYSGRYQRTNRDDRGDHSNIAEHDKQAAHGWGAETGAGEWADEKAGEAIAKAEATNDAGWAPDTSGGDPAFTNGPGGAGELVGEDAVAEPEEEKTKSYDEYLAELAEKRLALGNSAPQARKANEGSKQKFPTGTEVKRQTEDYFAAAEEKARKEKIQKDKNRLQLDGQYYAAADSGDRRGGGRGRGGRGRGEGRGEFRGGRGGDRGGRGRGDRDRGDGGNFRGGNRGSGPRGGSGGAVNTNDSSAFPALGS